MSGQTQARDRLAASFPIVALAMVGVIAGVAQVMGVLAMPGDATADWFSPPGKYELGVYVYSPLLTQLIEPFRWVGWWQGFIVLWTTINFASLGYVFGRGAFLVLLLFIPAAALPGKGEWWSDPITIVLLGNVTLPILAAMVAGMRHPGWWFVPILTKITPGIGILWFAFRREWRPFAIGVGVTALIAGVGFALAPDAWIAYVRFALQNAGSPTDGPVIVGPPLAVRIPIAIVLMWAAARWRLPRLVPIAGAVGIIGLYGIGTFLTVAMGALSPRLSRTAVFGGPEPGPEAAASAPPLGAQPTSAPR